MIKMEKSADAVESDAGTTEPSNTGELVLGDVTSGTTSTQSSLAMDIISQAKGFCRDITELRGKLTAAQHKIAEQEWTILKQSVKLSEAEDVLEETKRRLAEMEEQLGGGGGNGMAALTRERTDKAEIEQKYERLKNSVASVTGEFRDFMEKLMAGFLETDGNAQPINSEARLQMKLEQLSALLQNKLLAWTQRGFGLEPELADMRNVMENIARILESRQACSSQQRPAAIPSQIGIPPPPQNSAQNLSRPTAKNSTPSTEHCDDSDDGANSILLEYIEPGGNVPLSVVKTRAPNDAGTPSGGPAWSFSGNRHAINLGKRHKGFFCICGRMFVNRRGLEGHIRFMTNRRRKHFDLEEPDPVSSRDQDHNEDINGSQAEHEGDGEAMEEGEEEEEMVHMAHPGRPGECVCGIDCNGNKKMLDRHIKYYTVKPKVSPRNLSRGQATPSSGGKFTCSHCDLTFQQFSKLNKHLESAHDVIQTDSVIGCVDCGISFSSRSKHILHRIRVHHSKMGRKKRRVATTNSETPSPPISPEHHVPVSDSEEMEETTPSSRDIEQEDCNFKCGMCKERFFCRTTLRRHLLILHKVKNIYLSGRKELGCVSCGLVCETWLEMRQHIEAEHQEYGDAKPETSIGRNRTPRN